jgi:hypothetical protein
MSKIEDGGPAFPCVNEQLHSGHAASGMSLRDWFAGQALVGLCSQDERLATVAQKSGQSPERIIAFAAYEVADAMLAARKTGGGIARPAKWRS